MDFITNPVGTIAKLISDALAGLGLAPGAILVVQMALGVIVIGTFCLLLPLFLIWFERRVVARMQDRVGPNRVGWQGLAQTIADALKLLIKEDITPIGADILVYNLSPIISVVAVIAMWAVVPFAYNMMGVDLNVGTLYIVAVGSLGTLAIMMGGWSSNNKYALLGAFRTVAQLVSYEAPMILSMLVPVLLTSSMSMAAIVHAQKDVWYIFSAPIAALLFFITSIAEVGRTPFDLLEAESEIVAGFHIEYTGMKFGMFFVAEFLHAFTVGAFTAILFLGGWNGPLAESIPWLGVVYFILKGFVGYFVVILIRASLPRIRIDHMLDLCWKFFTPLALGSIIFTMLTDKLVTTSNIYLRSGAQLAANLVLAWITLQILSASARKLRAQEAGADSHAAPAGGHGDEHGGHDHGHAAEAHAAPAH